MSTAYWDQWDGSEIFSMHGIDDDHLQDDDVEWYNNDLNPEEDSDESCLCTGSGCNHCLMVSW